MEFSPPYACIYQISLYCPLCMHTYLLMWDELASSARSADEDLSLYIDDDVALKRFSKNLASILEECLSLQKIGCLEITSITSESVYLNLCDVTELSIMLEDQYEED